MAGERGDKAGRNKRKRREGMLVTGQGSWRHLKGSTSEFPSKSIPKERRSPPSTCRHTAFPITSLVPFKKLTTGSFILLPQPCYIPPHSRLSNPLYLPHLCFNLSLVSAGAVQEHTSPLNFIHALSLEVVKVRYSTPGKKLTCGERCRAKAYMALVVWQLKMRKEAIAAILGTVSY